MKTTMKFYLGLACGLLQIAPSAFAQGGSSGMGGGGDYLACMENGAKKHFLLDTYEEKDQWTIDAGNGATVAERVSFVLDRLSRIDPERATRYQKEAIEIINGIAKIQSLTTLDQAFNVYRAKKPLLDIDDSNELYDFEREGCKKQQLVRQEINTDNGQNKFTIDFSLFDVLNLNQQTATVLHEIIYHELRERGAQTSKYAREFNRLILDPRFLVYPSCKYAAKTKLLGFGGYKILGSLPSDSADFTCDGNGNIESVKKFDLHFSERSADVITLADMKLREGRIPVEAKVISPSFAYPKIGERVSLMQYGPLSQGNIHFESDGSLLWTDVLKSDDSGKLRIKTGPDFKVISFQDEGYFNESLESSLRKKIEKFIWAVKPFASSMTRDPIVKLRVAAWTSVVRRAVPSGDLNAIDEAITGLQDDAASLPQIEDSIAVQDWLIKISNREVTHCSYSKTGLQAAAGFGIALAVQSLRCFLENGDVVKFKSKPQFRIGAGLGGGIHHVSRNDSEKDDGYRNTLTVARVDDRHVRVTIYSGDQFIAGPISSTEWQGLSTNSWGAGLSIFLEAFGDDFKAIKFKDSKTAMGIGGLVEALTSKILVNRSFYPKKG